MARELPLAEVAGTMPLLLLFASEAAAALLAPTRTSFSHTRTRVRVDASRLRLCDTGHGGQLSCVWKATEDNFEDNFIGFNENHYRAMLADVRRTHGYTEALKQRLAQHPPGTLTVLDLGTGPFAVLGFAAVKAGAKKVYCVEANPAVAERARQEIRWAEESSSVEKDTIEVLEGFSTDISLPEKVDLLVTEIAGSIASEEGVYATIKDAQRRFMKRPHDPASYIPYSYETWGAPSIDMAHHSGGSEGKLSRVEADDTTLQARRSPPPRRQSPPPASPFRRLS